MKIRKSQLRQAVNEQVQAFFVTPQSMGMVGIRGNTEGNASKLKEDDIDKNELKNIISQIVDDVQNAATSRMQSGAGGRVDHTGKLTEATKWYDAIKRPVKVGDKVHIGHIKKGGAGVTGIVTKIKGDRVDIKDPKSKRTFYGSLKKTAIMEISGVDSLKPNDPHTPEDEAEKDAADDVMEAGPKKKGGRPRGAPHIENVRFWDLPEKSLRYIIKDAGEAIAANPLSRKATGKWADEINDAVAVLHFRKKKGIKVDESFNTAPAGQGEEHASVIGANETPEIGSSASTTKGRAIIKKMYDLVTKQLKFKTVEDIQPLKGGGVAFIFGDKAEASKMEKYLKKAGALGKVIPLRAGGGKRTMVSLRAK